MTIIDAGLILEGGGMRGVYTAGVLDYFIDQGIYFNRDLRGIGRGLPRLQLYFPAAGTGLPGECKLSEG